MIPVILSILLIVATPYTRVWPQCDFFILVGVYSCMRVNHIINMCDITHSYGLRLLHVCHDSFTRTPWLVHTWVPWLMHDILICDLTDSYMRHDSFILVAWLPHVYDLTHAAYCSVLPCVAVCCSVLPCVAVCCRVLPCVATSSDTPTDSASNRTSFSLFSFLAGGRQWGGHLWCNLLLQYCCSVEFVSVNICLFNSLAGGRRWCRHLWCNVLLPCCCSVVAAVFNCVVWSYSFSTLLQAVGSGVDTCGAIWFCRVVVVLLQCCCSDVKLCSMVLFLFNSLASGRQWRWYLWCNMMLPCCCSVVAVVFNCVVWAFSFSTLLRAVDGGVDTYGAMCCCSVVAVLLQCCCSVVAVVLNCIVWVFAFSTWIELQTSVLHCVATHWNELQHTATHCNTLQHTATHCNTL